MMIQIPAPDAIFGRQGITQEDKDYQGSRFSDVKAAIFANPYQKVWGDPNEPPLPNYKTTNKSVYAGTLPGGQPPNSNSPLSELWILQLIYVGEKIEKAFEDCSDPTAYVLQAYGRSPRTIPTPAISKKAVRA